LEPPILPANHSSVAYHLAGRAREPTLGDDIAVDRRRSGPARRCINPPDRASPRTVLAGLELTSNGAIRRQRVEARGHRRSRSRPARCHEAFGQRGLRDLACRHRPASLSKDEFGSMHERHGESLRHAGPRALGPLRVVRKAPQGSPGMVAGEGSAVPAESSKRSKCALENFCPARNGTSA
jgi:hypothetical protein